MNQLNTIAENSDQNDLTLIEHLAELRSRILLVLFSALVSFAIAMAFSNRLVRLILGPLYQAVPTIQPAVLDLTEGFVATIKLAFWVGFAMSLPVAMWELWRFVAPALTSSERKWAVFLLLSVLACFFVGMIFCWFVVLPSAISFLMAVNRAYFVPMISYSGYIDFVVTFVIVMGLLFELPLLLAFLDAANILPVETFCKRRRETIVIAFILGAMFSPPDVVSQILVSLPIIVLVEIGIYLSRLHRYLCHAS